MNRTRHIIGITPIMATMILGFVLLLNSSVQGYSQAFTNFAALDSRLFATITNTQTSDEVLLQAICHLGKITESPGFWTRIANDTNYSSLHRQRAVFALFRRHAERAYSSFDLAHCLTPALWLEDSAIKKLDPKFEVLGFLPIEIDGTNSVFEISVLHRFPIFIRVRGEADYQTFASQIRGKIEPNSKTNYIITEYAYGDDYRQWLENREY